MPPFVPPILSSRRSKQKCYPNRLLNCFRSLSYCTEHLLEYPVKFASLNQTLKSDETLFYSLSTPIIPPFLVSPINLKILIHHVKKNKHFAVSSEEQFQMGLYDKIINLTLQKDVSPEQLSDAIKVTQHRVNSCI